LTVWEGFLISSFYPFFSGCLKQNLQFIHAVDKLQGWLNVELPNTSNRLFTVKRQWL